MTDKILKICLCAVFALLSGNLSAQYATALTVTDIEQSVARKMEANATALLTELNQAFFNGKTPQLIKISGMSKDGKTSVLAMWEMTPFRSIETEIIERGYNTGSGYQVRNIPLYLKDMPEDEAYKEIAINFDKSGAIDDIFFSLDMHIYKAIMESENNDVTDLRRRQAILNFVENFRTAYNRKDIELLAKVYSDDALIITGKVIKQTKSVENVLGNYGFSKEKIDYQVQTKKEYINKLRSIFKSNAKINVLFDSIEVVRHPKYDDIYGVRLNQGWNTSNYSDVGFLFLMIDFKDGENMEINVRTWQPEKLNGELLSEDEILGIKDFEVIESRK
ncbi:MAG: nuclear transport factor 2 family protein [Candidatus Symbiothrix sp.]|nr:nuclear transport factor 2 family protein [Candidatus Symbiothrix sp.]